eukprot:4951284-Amphidinium_carterae.1
MFPRRTAFEYRAAISRGTCQGVSLGKRDRKLVRLTVPIPPLQHTGAPARHGRVVLPPVLSGTITCTHLPRLY